MDRSFLDHYGITDADRESLLQRLSEKPQVRASLQGIEGPDMQHISLGCAASLIWPSEWRRQVVGEEADAAEADKAVQLVAKKGRIQSKTIGQGLGSKAEKARFRRFSSERVC